jgi:uncharacterized protein YbjT (DUF2867 family)
VLHLQIPRSGYHRGRMTVAVVGGSGLIGRATLRRLVGRDPEVRALVRRPAAAESLRSVGVKVAVGDVIDSAALEAVVAGAFSVVHLVGSVNEPSEAAYRRANVESVERTLEAAVASRVRRVAVVSHAGASPDADNPYLRTMALAEHAVLASDLEGVVVRTDAVYGVGGVWFTCAVELALDDPPAAVAIDGRELRPAFADDLAAVLASVDDRPEPVAGRWGFEGPDAVTAEQLASTVRGDDREIRRLDPAEAAARLRALLGRPISVEACRVFADRSPAVSADAPDAAAAFGVARTRLGAGLRETASRAAGLERARLEG